MHLKLGNMEYLKPVAVFSEMPLFNQSDFSIKRAQTELKTSPGQKPKHEQNFSILRVFAKLLLIRLMI